MADVLYKGYVETQTESGTMRVPVKGIPLGRDSATNRIIFAVAGKAVNVFMPGRSVVVNADYRAECVDTAMNNTGVVVGVVLLDKVQRSSSCIDKNGEEIFDGDIISVDNKLYRVYFCSARLNWELVQVNGALDDCGKPISLYRLKDKISQVATLLPMQPSS